MENEDPARRVGRDTDRVVADPAIPLESLAYLCDLPLTESTFAQLTIPQATEFVLWVEGLLHSEPIKSRPGWEGTRRMLVALHDDFLSASRWTGVEGRSVHPIADALRREADEERRLRNERLDAALRQANLDQYGQDPAPTSALGMTR